MNDDGIVADCICSRVRPDTVKTMGNGGRADCSYSPSFVVFDIQNSCPHIYIPKLIALAVGFVNVIDPTPVAEPIVLPVTVPIFILPTSSADIP